MNNETHTAQPHPATPHQADMILVDDPHEVPEGETISTLPFWFEMMDDIASARGIVFLGPGSSTCSDSAANGQ
jgi:hypothetical protein